MSDGSAKQQIVDKIKSTTNILVTVSNDPSVDELSAALGLTLLLNKMKKHATAVFSGQIPPAMSFLDPAKTFENTVDSLRDFIIALDKEKADHLRYKVEGDVVKIFITPYRTTITGDDLDFSQGDYNVEMVLALGVKNQDSLDTALEAHGRILHDATVATVMAGSDKSQLGSISWHDENASSLSEMIVTLSDSLKADKSLIDEQTATAFLTGLVAATERFSNNRTSARVMTMAAQLMGAGANQQLIASKFEEADSDEDFEDSDTPAEPEPPQQAPVSEEEADTPENTDGTTDLSEGESTKLEHAEPPKETPKEPVDGTLNVSHEKEGNIDEVAEQTVSEGQAAAAMAAEAELAEQTTQNNAEQELAEHLPQVVAPTATSVSLADLQKDIAHATDEVETAAEMPPLQGAVSAEVWKKAEPPEPAFGGTLNATTEAAAEEAQREEDSDRNKTILSHGSGYVADEVPAFSSPINASNDFATKQAEQLPAVNPLEEPANPTTILPPPPTLLDIDRQNRTQTPTLPPLPDFSTLPPLPPSLGENQAVINSSNLPSALAPEAPPAADDPAQFKIPGQP